MGEFLMTLVALEALSRFDAFDGGEVSTLMHPATSTTLLPSWMFELTKPGCDVTSIINLLTLDNGKKVPGVLLISSTIFFNFLINSWIVQTFILVNAVYYLFYYIWTFLKLDFIFIPTLYRILYRLTFFHYFADIFAFGHFTCRQVSMLLSTALSTTTIFRFNAQSPFLSIMVNIEKKTFIHLK